MLGCVSQADWPACQTVTRADRVRTPGPPGGSAGRATPATIRLKAKGRPSPPKHTHSLLANHCSLSLSLHLHHWQIGRAHV